MSESKRGRFFRRHYQLSDGFVIVVLLLLFLAFTSLFVFLQRDFFFGAEPERPLQISVILPDEGILKQSALREGMEQAAFENNCELSFLAPISPNSLEEQQALLLREWEQRPDAVILSPISNSEQLAALDLSRRAPKLCLVNVWPGMAEASLRIAPDYYEMVRVLTARIVKERPGLKRVYIYSATADNPFDQIMPELLRAFSEQGISDVELLRQDAAKIPEMLAAEKPLIERASLLDPSSAYLALDELSLSLLAKGLDSIQDLPFAPLFGWGLSAEGLRLLDGGRLSLLLVDDQYSVGYLAVSQSAAQLRHPKESASTKINFALIDQFNKDTLANQHLLYPIVQ